MSGDHNPIHLHPLTAKALGYPRQLAHGMWSLARCVAALENRHKILNDKDSGKKPSLRRTSSTDKNGKDSKGDDDDHPTLKRRQDDKQ